MTIAHNTKIRYNTLMVRKLLLIAILILAMVPHAAFAYVNPEDVLLNRELLLPPSSRESQQRSEIQAQESAARREREQDAAFALQYPYEEELYEDDFLYEEEPLQASAPAFPQGGFLAYPVPVQGNVLYGNQALGATSVGNGNLDAANMELLRTMRLLARVNQNQAQTGILQHGQSLHAGAPLAPTGTPMMIATATIMGAILWTMGRAKKAERNVVSSL